MAIAGASDARPLGELVARLEGDWQLEETGKAYWIGYTEDMRSIATYGETAIEPLVNFMKTTKSKHAKYGALLALHYIGIRGRVVGRFTEALTCKPARDALIGLLSEPDLRLDALPLLIRDPWPSDVPRLLQLLKTGTPDDWAVVKALQRYELADAPVHQRLTERLASLRCPIEGATASTDSPEPGGAGGIQARVTLYGSNSTNGSFKHVRLEALRRMSPDVVVEPGLVDSEVWNSEFDGYGDSALPWVLRALTDCDYLSLGDKLEYYVEDGSVHVCSAAAAKARWLAWYEKQTQPLRGADPLAVLFACFNGGIERVSVLLEANPDGLNVRGPERETPLHIASEYGLVDIVALLLKRGAEPDLVDNSGQTALHKAAAKGHTDVARTLIEGGCPVDRADLRGATPLAIAAREGHEKTVELLIQQRAAIDIFVASAKGATDVVSRLLRSNASLANARDGAGLAPLHYAARFGRVDVVEALFAVRAHPDGNARQGTDTPLHEAARRGHVEVMRTLIRRGANVHAIGGLWDVHTPLQEAAREGRLEAVRLLLASGARVNDNFESRGRPALQWACVGEYVEIVKALLADGADVNQTDVAGTTALWWATEARHNKELEKLLVERGATKNQGPGAAR